MEIRRKKFREGDSEMKFMPQDMFEVCVLYLSKYKLLGDKAVIQTKAMLHESYKDSYKGDVLWLSQAEEPMYIDICAFTLIERKEAEKAVVKAID